MLLSNDEYLGMYIHFMSTLKILGIGNKLTKSSPNILYLISTDDCLLFCIANK